MPDNFKQVVNLQSKLEDSDELKPKPKPKAKPRPAVKARSMAKRKSLVSKAGTEQRPVSTKKKSRTEDIDHVYNDEAFSPEIKEELLQINRPKFRDEQSDFFKKVSVIFFLVIIALLSFYFLVDKKQTRVTETETVNSENLKGDWYYVQLANKETYYGFIRDTSADPVVLEKVYYNYNQISGENDGKEGEKANTNIRLVKRGKESHGPDGTMDIVRSQVMYMEILGEESKILKAILDYEE